MFCSAWISGLVIVQSAVWVPQAIGFTISTIAIQLERFEDASEL